ncbi:MAG: TfoX/Sxy family protein [Gemmatimonadetes bacterium]|nr:TfoX/Sxy family protein [Gemmatimonadota bacterium]
MAFDEGLAHRIREIMQDRQDVSERRMFGGLAFLVNGNMAVGVVKDELMVRVGPDDYESALGQPHAREMDFTGRALRGFVYVDEAGISEDEDLSTWVDRAISFAESLPRK